VVCHCPFSVESQTSDNINGWTDRLQCKTWSAMRRYA